MTKNSLKTGPDELGYYGEGASAMGGMAVGETLMPALHELNQGFEEAIKDKDFLDEFAYYCKHYILDVSGSLESSKGVKDINKIDKFLNTVHNINS